MSVSGRHQNLLDRSGRHRSNRPPMSLDASRATSKMVQALSTRKRAHNVLLLYFLREKEETIDGLCRKCIRHSGFNHSCHACSFSTKHMRARVSYLNLSSEPDHVRCLDDDVRYCQQVLCFHSYGACMRRPYICASILLCLKSRNYVYETCVRQPSLHSARQGANVMLLRAHGSLGEKKRPSAC
jgi:hypothetical protein